METAKDIGSSSPLMQVTFEANSPAITQSHPDDSDKRDQRDEAVEGNAQESPCLSDSQLELDMDLMFVGDHDDLGDESEDGNNLAAVDDDIPGMGPFEVSDDSNSSAGSSTGSASGARLTIRSSRSDRVSERQKGMFIPCSLPINVGGARGHNFGGRKQPSEDDDQLLLEEEEEELFGPRGQLWICGQSFNDFAGYKDRMSKAMNRKNEGDEDFFNDLPVGRFNIVEASNAARLRPA
jgi:hypothetical protein